MRHASKNASQRAQPNPPDTRTKRLHSLRVMLERESFSTQASIKAALGKSGLQVDQATLSRDLEILGAQRIRDNSGHYKYQIPLESSAPIEPRPSLKDLLIRYAVSVARSGDLVIVRTPPACAAHLAYALDRFEDVNILGTIAGDDTVMIVAKEGQGKTIETQLLNPDVFAIVN